MENKHGDTCFLNDDKFYKTFPSNNKFFFSVVTSSDIFIPKLFEI